MGQLGDAMSIVGAGATVPGVNATQDVGTFMTAHNNGSGTSGEVDFTAFATS